MKGGLIFEPQGCGVKHFTPKEARRFYLSSGVFPSRMLWIHGLSYSLAEPLGHINTLAQMLHFANWSFHFIRKYCHSADFFNSNKLHIVTTGTLWNKTFATINHSTQMIFFIDLLSERLIAFVKRSKMLPNKKTDQETRKSWPNKRN